MKFAKVSGNMRLSGVGTTELRGSNGSVVVGVSPGAYVPANPSGIFVRRLRLFNNTPVVIDLDNGDVTGAIYTPAVAQVERAAIAGTITQSGTLKVTVTRASGATDYYVPIMAGDSAATVGAKCVAYLRKNAPGFVWSTLNASGQKLEATRILADLYGYANDSTMNVALANGTCLGFTAAPTSANTTAGSVANGAYVLNATGDAEGITIDATVGVNGLTLVTLGGGGNYKVECNPSGFVAHLKGDLYFAGEGAIIESELKFTLLSGWVDVLVVVSYTLTDS